MKIILLISMFLVSCGHQYPYNPNANVAATVQYENGPPKLILSPNYRPQHNCGTKKGADCAAALYNESLRFIKEADALAKKELYLSATLSTMQAMTRLSEADIRLKKAKTENYSDWKVAVILGLEKKIKEKIKLCEKKINLYKWKR